MTHIEDPSHGRAVPDLSQSSQDNAIPHTLLHLNHTKAKFFPQAPFDPLLSFTDMAKILVCLKKVPLDICPITEPGRGQRCHWSRGDP